jgi:hypothetical protein
MGKPKLILSVSNEICNSGHDLKEPLGNDGEILKGFRTGRGYKQPVCETLAE